MAGFQNRQVIFDHAAQAHDVDRVGPERLVQMIAIGDKEENACQKNDDDNAGSRSREQFDVKMSLAKQPGQTPANEGKCSAAVVWHRREHFRPRHYNCQKAGLLPMLPQSPL